MTSFSPGVEVISVTPRSRSRATSRSESITALGRCSRIAVADLSDGPAATSARAKPSRSRIGERAALAPGISASVSTKTSTRMRRVSAADGGLRDREVVGGAGGVGDAVEGLNGDGGAEIGILAGSASGVGDGSDSFERDLGGDPDGSGIRAFSGVGESAGRVVSDGGDLDVDLFCRSAGGTFVNASSTPSVSALPAATARIRPGPVSSRRDRRPRGSRWLCRRATPTRPQSMPKKTRCQVSRVSVLARKKTEPPAAAAPARIAVTQGHAIVKAGRPSSSAKP